MELLSLPLQKVQQLTHIKHKRNNIDTTHKTSQFSNTSNSRIKYIYNSKNRYPQHHDSHKPQQNHPNNITKQ